MSKKKVKIQCTEMQEADVQFISLVPRGAIRVPFRILKEAKEMLNLANIFRSKKEEKVEPKVVAVVVSKGSDFEKMTLALKEAGLEVSQINAVGEDYDVFQMQEEMPPEITTIKLTDDIAICTQKGFDSWPESNSFTENVKTKGFFPGLYIALETMEETVRNIMYSASSAPIVEVNKAVAEFQEYLTGLINTIPTTAFKLETLQKILPEVVEETIKEEVDEVPLTETSIKTEEDVMETNKEEIPGEVIPEEVVKEEVVPVVLTMEMVGEMIQKAVGEALSVVKADSEAQIATLTAAQEVLKAELAEAKEKAVKIEADVRGSVSIEPLQDTGLNSRTRAAKSEGEAQGSVFEDAFILPGLG